jgi:transposase
MENLLELYARSYDPREPVVGFDERPVQLLDDARPGIPARPGRIAREDYEYLRRGTANVFLAVEPLAGRHYAKATPDRSGPQFAEALRDIARRYPRAKTIHLVVDNLNSHSLKSCVRRFGPRRGRKLWERFTIHYTPKHGSWLNQAEIEISLYSRQCLRGQRTRDFWTLASRTNAWMQRAEEERWRIRWGFTVNQAREKFRYRRSRITRSEH